MTKQVKFYQKMIEKLPFTRSLIKDERGVAAIEFAFIAPIMIAMYFGMTEVAMGITADRNVAHATSVTGDLATQVASINADDMSDVMTATLAVLGARSQDLANITIELTSYQEISGTDEIVGYAIMAGANTGTPTAFDPSTLNTQMLNAQSGVVVARIYSNYQPVTYKFMNDMVLSETFIMKPRKSISVPFEQDGSSSFTCIPSSDLTVNCS